MSHGPAQRPLESVDNEPVAISRDSGAVAIETADKALLSALERQNEILEAILFQLQTITGEEVF